jgi:site-specific DNA recombinase
MGNDWRSTTISSMLENPLWSGQLRVEDKIVPGQHPAIISKEQFQLAQEIRAGHKQYPNASQQSKYLLSGLACCGQCGKRLVAHTVYQGEEKKPYTFYHHARDLRRNGCPGIYKSISKLEKAVLDQIGMLSHSGALEQAVHSDVVERLKDQNAPKLEERDKILLELQSMEERFTRWADRLDSGKIDEEQFEQQNSRLLVQKAQLQERLSALQSDLGQTEHIELTLSEVRKVLQEFPTVWEALEHEERREMLRLLIEELRVYKTHIELKLLFLDSVEVLFGTGTKKGTSATAPDLKNAATSKEAATVSPSRQRKANAKTSAKASAAA